MSGLRLVVGVCLGGAMVGCGSRAKGPDLGSDPDWGQGFSARPLVDAGDPDAPASAAVACSLFQGPPYAFTSIADLTDRLVDKQWIGCSDNAAVDNGKLFPTGFAALTFDGAGNWQAFVHAPDGSLEPATGDRSQGTYNLSEYFLTADTDSGQYAGMFVLHMGPPVPAIGGSDDPQFQGVLFESPEILWFYSSNLASTYYRFSSAPP